MEINVTQIVQDRIDNLQSEGTVERAIADTFEKALIQAVTFAIDSYKVKRIIEDKVTEQVSKAAADLDFQSYNSFMIEKMSQILNEVCREDICQKAEKRFKDIFLCQTKEIKLSSIFEKYREIACEEVPEQEKYDRIDEGWHCKCESDDKYGWIKCELDYEDKTNRYTSDNNIYFTVHRDFDNRSIGRIYSLYLDGRNIEDKFKFGHLNDVELLLVQAVLNEIPIIIDVESTDDIDNSFDVDY